MNANNKKNIIYFDGNCGLCHQFINLLLWIIRPEFLDEISFAPIGGATFKDDSRVKFHTVDSVFIVWGDHVFIEGQAILAILPLLKKRYFLIGLIKFLPKPLLNYLYRKIAANRQRISCYLSKNSKIRLLP